MNPQEPQRKPRGRPETHGITTLRTAVNRLGSRVIDRRTALGKALARWRAELVQDLGGPEALSTQQQAIIDLCVREKLMLDSIDAWIVQQPSLINRRARALLPVVKERTQIADALARHLSLLGLDQAERPAASLQQIVEEFAAEQAQEANRKPLDGVQHSIEGATAPQDQRGAVDGAETQAAVEIAKPARRSRDDAGQESEVPEF